MLMWAWEEEVRWWVASGTPHGRGWGGSILEDFSGFLGISWRIV